MYLKSLKDLIPEEVGNQTYGPEGSVEITGITMDSRKAKKGFVFVAVKGIHSDGHDFIDHAVENGASVIVSEAIPITRHVGVRYFKCNDSRAALAVVADNYFGNPSRRLKLIGVTGTNGKTTIVTLLFRLFRKLGLRAGMISTIENRVNETKLPASYTTPFPVEINEMLNQMVEEGCQYAFMEVSSHSIDQKRIDALSFAGGIFTNITHDHLEYHESFKKYIQTKKKFFDLLTEEAFALYNADDRNGKLMVGHTKARVFVYSMRSIVDYKGRIIEKDLSGMQIKINEYNLYTRLIGFFNAYNLLAVYSVADIVLGMNEEIVRVISDLVAVDGRFEVIRGVRKKMTAIVDYAHTPDALQNVLKTIKEIRSKGKIIVVAGCGGDRDKLKRPKMGRIAAEFGDYIILTSDNPRSEDPDLILDEMYEGIDEGKREKVLRIQDRKEAIRLAVSLCDERGIVVVAGKGHEKYQEIRGMKIPFDDIEILKALLLEDI